MPASSTRVRATETAKQSYLLFLFAEKRQVRTAPPSCRLRPDITHIRLPAYSSANGQSFPSGCRAQTGDSLCVPQCGCRYLFPNAVLGCQLTSFRGLQFIVHCRLLPLGQESEKRSHMEVVRGRIKSKAR